MACACKSNNSVRKQVTQVTKKTLNTGNSTSNTQTVVKSTTPRRKQIIIRRPAR